MIEDGPRSLTYSEAETVGRRLCTRFSAITGQNPPVMRDEAWADVVQSVMRWAGNAIARRPSEDANP